MTTLLTRTVQNSCSTPRHTTYLIGLIILLGILIAYIPAFTIFLRGDDFEWLNNSYAAWSHPTQLLELINNFFRPVVKVSYLLNYTFGGTQAIVYNLTTIGIHLANVFLLYVLILNITRQWSTAALVALLFGTSSLYSEITLWAAGRPDSLLLLFMLATLLVAADMTQHAGTSHQIALVLLTLGALGSKETWILLPIITLSFFWLLQRRTFTHAVRLTAWQWALFAIYLIIFFGLPLLRGTHSPTSYANAGIETVIAKFTHLIMLYCGLGDWFSGVAWQLAVVVLGVLGALGWAIWSKNRLAAWGLLWMILTLGISLPIYYEPSRYNYLPLLGFWVGVVSLGEPALRRLAQFVTISPILKKAFLGSLLVLYISHHLLLLQTEVQDYAWYGEFHKIIFDMYTSVQDQVPAQSPVLIVNTGTQKPTTAISESAQGYPKLFFVRPTALWEMLYFQSLANFAGDPFQRLFIPVKDDVLHILNAPVTVVIFTDRGFKVVGDDEDMRMTLRQLYHTHTRLPDNITLYSIIPTAHYGYIDNHTDL